MGLNRIVGLVGSLLAIVGLFLPVVQLGRLETTFITRAEGLGMLTLALAALAVLVVLLGRWMGLLWLTGLVILGATIIQAADISEHAKLLKVMGPSIPVLCVATLLIFISAAVRWRYTNSAACAATALTTHAPPPSGFGAKRIFGLAGSLLAIVGVFIPMIEIGRLTKSFIQEATGLGLVVLGLGVVALLAVLLNRFLWLLWLIGLLILVFTIGQLARISDVADDHGIGVANVLGPAIPVLIASTVVMVISWILKHQAPPQGGNHAA